MRRAFLVMIVSSVVFADGAPLSMGEGASKWTPPVPEVRALKSGATAWVLTRPGLPLVSVSWVAPAGARHEDAAKAGLASLTAEASLEGGAGKHDPRELQEALEDLGVTMDLSTGVEGTTFSFTVLSSRLDAALALLLELLSQPRFDAPAFEALKARHLAELKTALDDPSTLAMVTAPRAVFGAQPEGRPADGTVAGVGRLTVDDVKAFHAARYGSAGATVVVVGDVSPDAVKQKFDALAAKPWLTSPPRVEEQTPTVTAPRWVGIERKGAPQTVLVGIAPGLAWRAPGATALELAGDVLGGSFTSRLNQNLREKRGYTYGATASAALGKRTGVLEVMTPVRTEVTGAALEQVVLELRGLATLSAEEHEKAVSLARAAAVNEFGSGAAIARAFSQVVLLGGKPESLREDAAALSAATVEQTRAVTRAFDPDGFTFVFVGDRSAIEAQLKKTFPTKTVEWLEAP